ncbi:ligand-binding sensor domain-containing protein [Streptobacillus felis]|nr:hypothetical protein [Streptobacillus felis]
MENKKIEILPCDINNKDTHFVFYENDEYTIWVSVFIEGERNDDILDNIIEEYIYRFSENEKFTGEYLKKILLKMLDEYEDRKVENDIENSKIFLSCILTDYSNVVYVYMKNYIFNIIRLEEVYYKNEIIDRDDFVGITEIFPLKDNDIINIFLYDENILSIKVNKVNQLTKFTVNSSIKFYFFISLLLLLISYFIFCNIYLNKKIEELEYIVKSINFNTDFDYKNNSIKIENASIKIKKIENKFLYYTTNKIKKREKIINEIIEFKNKNELLKELFNKRNDAKKHIYDREFIKSKEIYSNIQNNINFLSNDWENLINKEIDELNRLLIIQNNELFLNNDDVIKSNDILENILKEYEKSFFNINIKDLEIYKERYKKNIDEIKLKLDNRYVNIEKLINDDIIKSLEEIKFLRDEYLKLGLKNEVEYLNRFEKEVDEKINILEEKMKNNFSQHNSYYNNKEYTTAISYLEKSLYFANLLNNEEKKKEIEGKIRLIYKKKKNIENENIKKNEKTLDKEKLEFEIKKSIKLSIEKGDDYLKNDEYEKAFIEYKRALELMGKVNYSKNIRKEVEKKLQYINKKKDKKWWELWK